MRGSLRVGEVIARRPAYARGCYSGTVFLFRLKYGRIFLVSLLVEVRRVLAEHQKNGQTGGAGELGSHDRVHHGLQPAQLFVLTETFSVFWVLLSFSALLARQVFGMAVMRTGDLGVFFWLTLTLPPTATKAILSPQTATLVTF